MIQKKIAFLTVLLMILLASGLKSQDIQIALMKYQGGGDWYADPTALPNLIAFCNKNLGMDLHDDYAVVEPLGNDLYNYPFIHMTGHGNVIFSEQEVVNIRNYLLGGGFLHIDDNYGLDKHIRREMKKYFLKKSLWNYLSIMRFTIRNTLLKRGCRRSMNMTAKLLRALPSSTKAALSAITPTKQT